MAGRAAVQRIREGRTTRACVLDVAERQFAQRGFSGVTMREIASEAGLKNQASLYNHFANKQSLYEAVLSRGLEPIVALMTQSRGAGRARPRDVALSVEKMLDHLARHPEVPRLIQRAALDDGRRLRGTVTRLLRPVFSQGLTSLAASAVGRSPEELPYLALGLYHLIFGYVANAQLLEIVGQPDPLGAVSLARQRDFVKAAVTDLLAPRRRRPARLRIAR